jgi:tellurite resistance protein TerC
MTAITPWHWAGFILFVLLSVAVDLRAFHRQARVITVREAALWSVAWVALAVLFAALLSRWRGAEESTEFVTGYVLELSLSLDNILVIVLIFSAFRVPPEYQRRVLVWGVLGALTMRGLMIGAGVALVQRFEWVLYAFGIFLLGTGGKMLFARPAPIEPEKKLVVRLARRFFPISPAFDGPNFTARVNGALLLTPLALVLLLVEVSDVIFAMDSVPAVFAVTRKAFIVFTSNVFAVLGLRSMYFLMAGAIGKFRYLRAGLAVVLVFVGVKMLADPHDHPPQWFQCEIPTQVSLLIITSILVTAIGLSVARAGALKEKR